MAIRKIIIFLLFFFICVPANNKTDKVQVSWRNEINYCIHNYQSEFPIGERLIWSIIKAESPYYPFQPRYESHLRNAEWYIDAISDSPYKDLNSAYSSYGAMHVLYGVAYSMGYRGRPEDLEQTRHNIYYGMRYLWALSKTYKKTLDIISAYNQGKPRKDWRYVYSNQNYVDKVVSEYIRLGGDI